jgi:hypothetical protein
MQPGHVMVERLEQLSKDLKPTTVCTRVVCMTFYSQYMIYFFVR